MVSQESLTLSFPRNSPPIKFKTRLFDRALSERCSHAERRDAVSASGRLRIVHGSYWNNPADSGDADITFHDPAVLSTPH